MSAAASTPYHRARQIGVGRGRDELYHATFRGTSDKWRGGWLLEWHAIEGFSGWLGFSWHIQARHIQARSAA